MEEMVANYPKGNLNYMSDKEKETAALTKAIESKPKAPYVFLSHDTRDAEIAEAFGKLLSSVTAGVLKSFRSSDKRGTHGIEYGVEWFPELMKKLLEASDVVCLLTENSLNRPWILFEAGVAKGKLDTPILGLAVGIPLGTANTGPFAQFQNSDDEEDSLVKLVTQLVKKIPNAEPDDSVVRQQVSVFKAKVAELLKKKPEKAKELKTAKEDAATVAKLFEEIKVMFNDLPSRLESPGLSLKRRRSKRFLPHFIEEMVFMSRKMHPFGGFVMLLSTVHEEMPWIYDFGQELLAAVRRGDESEYKEILMMFHEIVDMTFHNHFGREERLDYPGGPEIFERLHHMAEELTRSVRKNKKG